MNLGRRVLAKHLQWAPSPPLSSMIDTGGRSLLRERIKFATTKGGVSSTLWWLLNKASGVETHRIFSKSLSKVSVPTTLDDHAYVLQSVRSRSDESALDPVLRHQLEQHVADGLAQLVSNGVEVFFLTSDRMVLSQLIICRGPRITIDSPAGVSMDIGRRRAFLSYLYTSEKHRRTGAAKRLMQYVCWEFRRRGYEALIAHVRATNVPSLSTFRYAGWQEIGTIWTRTPANWLFCTGLVAHGIRARRVSKNGSTQEDT